MSILHRDTAPVASYDDEPEEAGWFNKRLYDTRTILLTGRVDDTLARRVCQSLLILEADNDSKPIDIMINSGGGSVSAGFAIYDVMRFIKAPIRVLAAGLCGSIATIIYAAVTDRTQRASLPNTRFLIHQPLIPGDVIGVTSDLEITASEIVKTRTRINTILAEACGRPLAEVSRDTERDKWLSADEALEYGLVGRLISSRGEV